MKNIKVKNYLFLYANFFLFSCCSVLAKLAANYPIISMQAILLYSLELLILGIYAVLWQQILKRMPLTVAYANRAVMIFFGMLWGTFLFNETITWNMLCGAAVIICGIVIMGADHE